MPLISGQHVQGGHTRYDRILARNLFLTGDRTPLIHFIAETLDPNGRLHLAESIPHHAQRLYNLIPQRLIDHQLLKRWKTAEEKLYKDPKNPKVNWTEQDLLKTFTATGFTTHLEPDRTITPTYFSQTLYDRWFATDSQYFKSLNLSESDRAQIQTLATQHLLNHTIDWETPIFYLTASLTKT